MLSAVNDCATSGELPPRMAAMILSSLTPPTTLTVIHGCDWWKASTACLTTPSSRLVNPFQRVIVTGVRLAAVVPPLALPVVVDLLSPPPPQAPSATAASRADATAIRLIEPSVPAGLVRQPYETRPYWVSAVARQALAWKIGHHVR